MNLFVVCYPEQLTYFHVFYTSLCFQTLLIFMSLAQDGEPRFTAMQTVVWCSCLDVRCCGERTVAVIQTCPECFLLLCTYMSSGSSPDIGNWVFCPRLLLQKFVPAEKSYMFVLTTPYELVMFIIRQTQIFCLATMFHFPFS